MMLFSSSWHGCRSVSQKHVLLRLVFSFFVVSIGLIFGIDALVLRQSLAPPTVAGTRRNAPRVRRFPCAKGRVVFADGQPVRNAMLRFALLQGNNATALRYDGARTDRDGNFIGPEIPEGIREAHFAVTVSPDMLAPQNSLDVLAAPQTISVTRGHPAQMHFVLQPPAYVRGRVCTPHGRPVSGVWVQVPDVLFATGPTTYHNLTRATTDRDGNFVLAVPVGRVTVELERTAATVYHAPRLIVCLQPGQVVQATVPVSLRPLPDTAPIELSSKARYTALR